MFPQERRDYIEKEIIKNNSIKVSEIADLFNVSESTIRRDLQEMEQNNIIKRTHGGAIGITQKNFEPSFTEKEFENYEEKQIIGKLASTLIHDGDTIILDSGTTTLEIAKNIKSKDLTVITNSIDIAYELSMKESIKVIITGGDLRTRTRAMVGYITERTLKDFNVDKAFIGINGISLKHGISTPNHVEAQVKKAIIDSSNKVIVVADSMKFNSTSLSIVAPLEKINIIVTTKHTNNRDLEKYEEVGIKIVKE